MTAEMPDMDTYALRSTPMPDVAAPDLPYSPPVPKGPAPKIGLIGAGGISASHLDAYRTAGWEVIWICGRTRSKAESRAAEYSPSSRVTEDWRRVLDDPEVGIVDLTPHPADRLPLIEAALRAGKHVLTQKPFVLDLDDGERLVRLATDNGVRLAVNQNGRWAPHMAFMREVVRTGVIGEVVSAHTSVHWDHGWVAGTRFDRIEDLILYDFGIHWFDFIVSVVGDRARSVFATSAHAPRQIAKAPLMAQAMVRLDYGQASLVFDGSVSCGPRDMSFIAGTKGSVMSDGADIGMQAVKLTTSAGVARPALKGQWFNDGFRGAMGELMCAIEEGREPLNGAAGNLRSLALVFAAVESRVAGREIKVGTVRRMAKL